MKNIKIFLSIMAGVLLVACSNDEKLMISANPAAPVLAAPGQKTTAYRADSAAYVLSMDSTGTAETFICTPANYGVNITTNYALEIDKAGNNFANAQVLTSGTSDTLAVSVTQLYNMITDTTKFKVPIGVKSSFEIRVQSTIGASKQPLYSNTRTIVINPLASLKPFYMVTPVPYFIVGLGDGTWNNSPAGLGVSLIPLSVIPGNTYSSAGAGTFTYTGYFKKANGFKLIRDYATSSWNEQWGSSDGGLTPVHNSGSSQNFFVPSDGYYTITLNSIANTMSIVPATAPAKSFNTIGLIGEFNGWASDVAMSPTLSANNHIWYTTYTFTTNFTPPVGSGGMKFRANNDWGNNWGDGHFPIGLGVNGGTNVPFLQGTYVVIMNDIDGCYYFIKK